MKHKGDHPDSSFYCGAKRCRKTAWDTPEYLDDDDWRLAAAVVAELESGTAQGFFDAVWGHPDRGVRFFHQTLGWPEGGTYCRYKDYVMKTAFPGLRRHDLPKLRKALSERKTRERPG